MKKLVTKILVLILVLFSSFFVLPSSTRAVTRPECLDTANAAYTSTSCVNERLGFTDAVVTNAGVIFIKRNPISYLVIAMRILLGFAVVFTVFKIVLAGIKIAGSKEDGEKMKEGFKTVGFAVTGMVIALSALGITFFVQRFFLGSTFSGDQIIDCNDASFLATASPALVTKCNDIIN